VVQFSLRSPHVSLFVPVRASGVGYVLYALLALMNIAELSLQAASFEYATRDHHERRPELPGLPDEPHG